MTTFTALCKTAAVLTLISGGSALANGNPPVTKYQCWNGWIKTDPAYCPPMTPAQHETWSKSKAVSNSTSSATGGQGGSAIANGGNAKQAQRQGQSQRQSSRNDNRSSASTGPISIDNSNRQRMAANTAATVIPGGYGPANCFGDTNPSGSFGASMQVFGWGVAANSQKASNVCAVAALAGPAAALGYLQRMDPNMPRRIETVVPTGRLICPASAPILTEKGCTQWPATNN